MAKRVITGVVGLPILIAVLYFGGWFLAAPLLLVMLVGFWEFCRAFGKPKLPQMAGLLATAGLVVLFMLQMHMPLYAIAIPAAPLV
ncbi:MAG: phosphatidate cytidylyltransferase, partial [Defluviitaleaceae bacterium]|nr:phosphatidate cytidylyltransferase [Defluviitaleaceae bacterium]